MSRRSATARAAERSAERSATARARRDEPAFTTLDGSSRQAIERHLQVTFRHAARLHWRGIDVAGVRADTALSNRFKSRQREVARRLTRGGGERERPLFGSARRHATPSEIERMEQLLAQGTPAALQELGWLTESVMVTARRQGVAAGPGNTVERFHGTVSACGTFDRLCKSPDCGACGIVRNGFDLSRVGSNTRGFSRYGKGLYFTHTASKAADYANRAAHRAQECAEQCGEAPREHSAVPVILVCHVVAGRVKTFFDSQKEYELFTAPPEGFDSVCGEALRVYEEERGVQIHDPTRPLNHDELVVYDEASVEVVAVAKGFPLLFYDLGQPFDFLTNFFPVNFRLLCARTNQPNVQWQTTEHYFQVRPSCQPTEPPASLENSRVLIFIRYLSGTSRIFLHVRFLLPAYWMRGVAVRATSAAHRPKSSSAWRRRKRSGGSPHRVVASRPHGAKRTKARFEVTGTAPCRRSRCLWRGTSRRWSSKA